MLVTLLVLFVFQVSCDPYLYDQAEYALPTLIPLPGVFEKMKIQQMELQRQGGRRCRGYNIQRDCAYDEATKTAQVWVPNTWNVGWMGFQMYPNTDRKGSITTFFSDGGTWREVKKSGCILPYYSSPSIINAQEINIVTITCARKKTCPENDNTLIMYVDGWKKCEKDGTGTGTASNVPCRNEGDIYSDAYAYSIDVLRPTPLPKDGKTYVYGETARSTISFIIDWMQNENPYVIHQASGPYVVSAPLPSDYRRLRIQDNNLERDNYGLCKAGATQYRCNYDVGSKTAHILIPDTRNVGLVQIEVNPPASNQKRYFSVYFSDNGTWEGVHNYGCILPYYSTPSVIKAKHLSTVTIRCARMRTCRHDDNALSISIEGAKKCEKDGTGTGTASNVPCTKEADIYHDTHTYTLNVSRPTPLPADGKTTVYCETSRTSLSFIIDWNGMAAIEDPYRVGQAGGPYTVSIPVPMEFQKIKYDNREYDRLPNGMCRYIPPGGGDPWKVKCGYDSSTKIASVTVQNTRDVAWVGFEMFSSSPQKGYQTVFFTQGGTWLRMNRDGCILPQYSSPRTIYTTDQTAVTIKCARKKTCNNNDNTLIMSIEGTKKCEKDGSGTGGDANVPCRRDASPLGDVDVYSLDLLKPVIPTNDGNTYVYCGTSTSQISFVIYWNSYTDPYRVSKASGPFLLTVPLPMRFRKLRIRWTEYESNNYEMCYGGSTSRKCFYDPESKTANVLIPETRNVGWVSFEMYHGKTNQKGYVTVFFTDGGTWSTIDRHTCLLPTYSSPGLIRAKYLPSVTLLFARRKDCSYEPTAKVYVDGQFECDLSTFHQLRRCRETRDIHADWTIQINLFELDVLRPTPLPADGKTYVYSERGGYQISFVIDWNSAGYIADLHRFDNNIELYTVSIPVPMEFQKIKFDNREYDNLSNGICRHIPSYGGPPWEVPCSYDSSTKTATVTVPNTGDTAWIGFEMFSSSAQKGYQTFFCTQGGTWSRINAIGCILPQYSSPSYIYAEDQTTVTIKCARKKTCNNNDTTLVMSIEGTKKCEIDGSANDTDTVEPCRRDAATSADVDVYSLDVLKPVIGTNGGKTYVYCGTTTSQISFVVDWIMYKNQHYVDQPSGPYSASIPVPMDFQKIKYDNREYDRLSNGMCRYNPPGGGTPWEVRCGYDANTKTASVTIGNPGDTAWIGFEMFSSSPQKGYQTVFCTQSGTWSRINDIGCILPQYSSPSVIYAKSQTTVTIMCSRKKTCNNNDNTLIMSIEGTKKCEKDGSANITDAVVPCRRDAATSADVDVYSLDVLKPVIPTNDGKTYVYCGTTTSQISFVVDWLSS